MKKTATLNFILIFVFLCIHFKTYAQPFSAPLFTQPTFYYCNGGELVFELSNLPDPDVVGNGDGSLQVQIEWQTGNTCLGSSVLTGSISQTITSTTAIFSTSFFLNTSYDLDFLRIKVSFADPFASEGGPWLIPAQNGIQCSDIRVYPNPAGTISSITPTTICEDGTANVMFTATIGTGPYNVTINGKTFYGLLSGDLIPLTEGIDFSGDADNIELTSITDTNGGLHDCSTSGTPLQSVVGPTVNDIDPGTVSAVDAVICAGSSTTISENTAAVVDGAGLDYSWEISEDISFTSPVIDLSNVSSFPTGNLENNTGSDKVYYFRRRTTSILNGVSCSEVTVPVQVTVYPLPTATALPSLETICDNSTPSIVINSAIADRYNFSAVVLSGSATGFTVSGNHAIGDDLETSIIDNTSIMDAVVEYTVIPYSLGVNTTDEGGTGDDCLGTPFTVAVTIQPSPSGFSYAENPVSYADGIAITDNVPTVTALAPITYSVIPALPAGLSLNSSTGAISGTPTAGAWPADYTVTVTDLCGTTNTVLDITVDPVPYIDGECTLLNETFDVNPILSDNPDAGAWYPDRYRPHVFSSDAGRLRIGISASDGAQNRPSSFSSDFYNTQGRKIDQCGKCGSILKGDLYIPSDWATKLRRSGMWFTAFDATDAISFFGIVGFANVDGMSPTLRYWDNSAWVNLGEPTYDTWTSFEIALDGTDIIYKVNGAIVATLDSEGSTYFGNVIMQAFNFNDNTLGASYDPTPDNNYSAYWDNIITLGSDGNIVTNTNTGETFCSIQSAIDDDETLTGHVLEVGPGTYDEQVLVTKGVSINGVGVVKPIINFTGSPTGKTTLFDVSTDNVTINGLQFEVDVTKLHSAIIVSGAGIDNITITNNVINPYQSTLGTYVSGYGSRNAISINYDGYRVAAAGVDNIMVTGNLVGATFVPPYLGDADDIAFRSAVSIDEGGGSFTGNTFQTINHDVLVRFASNGNVLIDNNNFNGGGVQLSDHNSGAGTFTISNNNFDGSGSSSVLRLQNNQQNKETSVTGNIFSNIRWGISLENYNNVAVDNNSFTPLTGETNFIHISVNTKSISSNSNSIVQTTVDGSFTNNIFNGLGIVGGNAIGFYNHDSDNASFGTFTIGGVGNENEFNANIAEFIKLDDHTGSSDAATTPTDYPNGGGWTTTMACWDQDYDIKNNKFNVGAGLQLPIAMDYLQRTALEEALFHDPDASCTGELSFFLPVHNLTQNTYHQTIGEGIAAANSDDELELAEWTFNERVVVDKPLTIQGINEANTILDGTGLIGNGNGITINNGVTNVTVKKLTVQNFAGASGNTNGGIYAIGGNNNLLVDHVSILDNVGGSGFYANGPVNGVTITYVTSAGHTSGARGIVIWNGLKENINISNCHVYGNNCCGIELQDGTAAGVTMDNNNVHDNFDNGMAATGLTNGAGPNIISNNIVTDNGRFGIEIKMPNGNGQTSGDGSVLVSDNTVSLTSSFVSQRPTEKRDLAGIAVFRRGMLTNNTNNNIDIPTGVVVQNNIVSGFVQDNPASVSEGFGIVVEGTNHTVTGNTVTGNDVGIQRQAGHTPYNANTSGDGDQGDLADTYFGRGNSPVACGIEVDASLVSGNTVDTRDVPVTIATQDGFVLNSTSGETFCTIQAAINDAQTLAGHTILVSAGTYNEDVLVNKQLTIIGAGFSTTTIIGPKGGDGATVRISTAGVVIEGFTITRDGNTVAEWNDGTLNFAGVAIQGQTASGEIRDCKIFGNRSGIDINNSNGNNIHNNIIENNHTGLIFRNQTDNTLLSENFIINNRTVGVLFLDASGGTNTPVQTAANSFFNDNSISGNWYGQVVDRQSGGSLPLPGTTNIKNFECNWYGTTGPVVSMMNSAEPGYSSLIPVAFGGTAMAPGGQPDILGPASSNIDFSPYVLDGTDDDLVQIGFQPTGTCNGTPVVIDNVVATDILCGPTIGSISVTFSGGDGPFDIAWTGGSASGVMSPYTITPLLAGSYDVTITDSNTSMVTATSEVKYLPVTNTTDGTHFMNIQAAVDAVTTIDGEILEVCAGTYAENITIDKSLDIRGPNYSISPNGGSRVAEAVIVPSISAAGGEIFMVKVSNVSIDGFTIDGDNQLLASGWIGTNGADIDAAEGVTIYDASPVVNNLNVSNNIIQNLGYFGVTLFGASNYSDANTSKSGNVISNNLIRDLGYYNTGNGFDKWGGGVLLYNSHYARVTDNVMTNVRIGVQTGNFQTAHLGDPQFQVIDNNEIQARAIGIFYNLHNYTPWTISNNDITGLDNATEASSNIRPWRGMLLSSLGNNMGSSTISGNTIDGGDINLFTTGKEGINIWNVNGNAEAAINGGSISGVGTGIFLNNYEGYSSDATAGAHASITNLAINIEAGGMGIRVLDSPNSTLHADVSLDINTGVTVTGGAKGLSIENANASISGGGSLDDLSFTLMTDDYIQLISNAGDLDAVLTSFNGITGATASLIQNYAIEDKIIHKVDDNSLGFVRVKATEVFVTTASGSIQRGVDAASASDVVNVVNGTFVENVTVDKALTLKGANVGIDCPTGVRVDESIINASGTSGTKAIIVDADNVTIDGFTISNPLGSFGVYNQGRSDCTIQNNIVTDIGNSLTGSMATYGIAIEMGSAANMGDVLITGNCVNNIRGGENTSLSGPAGKANNGSGGGIAIGFSTAAHDINNLSIDCNSISTITASTVDFSDGGKGAYGIIINVGANASFAGKANSPSITANTISDLEGLWSHGVGLEGETPGALVANNFMNDFTDHKGNTDAVGVFVEDNDGASTIIIDENSFTNMALGVKNVTGASVNAEGNWYGSTASGIVASRNDGMVDFTPWLVDGTDEELGICGFQQDATGTPVVIDVAVANPSLFCANGSVDVTFSMGTGPYTIEWSGPSSSPAPEVATSPFSIPDLPVGMYTITVTDANMSTATVMVTIANLPVRNMALSAYYATIQEAVDAALTGHIIEVCAGDYPETININKDLTINGPNVGIPGAGTRVAEAVIQDGKVNILGSNTVVFDGFHVSHVSNSTPISLGGSAAATIQNCIIDRNALATVPGGPTSSIGIEISNGTALKNINNNLFTGDGSSLYSGTLSWDSGVYLNGALSVVNFEDNIFENCRTAINIDDMGAGITLSGNTFQNSGTYLSFGGTVPTTGSFTLGSNEFKTPNTFINLSNVNANFRLDITSSTLEGAAFNTLTLAELFLVEGTMYHRGRSGRNGLVTYVPNNQYVITAVNNNIQTAIDYATSGHIINIENGAYNQRLVIDKPLTLDGQSEAGVILDGTALGNGRGIAINNGVTNVTIQDLTVQNFAGSNGNTHAGIYGIGGNSNLTVEHTTIQNNVGGSGFYANGPVDNVSLDYVTSSGHTVGARGIVIWNGLKSNITITNCEVFGNNCCGIELQDGTASGVTMSNNNVHDNGDNGMSAVGLDGSVGTNVIANNIVEDNGRFGIEIKNPNGSTMVSGNTVSLTAPISDMRDLVGIAVFRRGVLAGNVDIPTGVIVTGNNISGYVQGSDSDGFGIVIEGTDHTVTGNTVSGNDVGIQQQAGHTPYPGDGDQSNLNDDYFGRGNSPVTCGNTISGNTLSANGIDERNVPASLATIGSVKNEDTGTTFCSIQSAIDAATTLDGHTLTIAAGTYVENVTVDKRLIINGVGTTTIVQGGAGNAFTYTASGSGASPMMRASLSSIKIEGSIKGIYTNELVDYLMVDGVAFDGNTSYGIHLNNTSGVMNDWIVNNSTFTGSSVGIHVGSSANISTIAITDCSFTNNLSQGIYTAQSSGSPGGFNNVTISGCTFTENGVGNNQSGLYFEKLSNALITDNIFTNNGLAANARAIIVNLKYSDYSDITISENTMSENRGVPTNGYAMFIAGRNDAPSYNSNPASLETVLISANEVDGFRIGIGFENNVDWNTTSVVNNKINNTYVAIYGSGANTGLTMNVHDNDLSVSGLNFIANGVAGNFINATCNWYGSVASGDIAPKIAGDVTFSPWYQSGGDGAGIGFQPTGFCTGTVIEISEIVPTHILCGPTVGSIDVTFIGGLAPYTIEWTGGGPAVPATSVHTITPLLSGEYTVTVTDANLSTATATTSVEYLPVTNTSGPTYHATIQAAINDASPSDIIEICAGDYFENIVVDKTVELRGPNYGLSPNGLLRINPEATLYTALSEADDIIHVEADNVVIDGIVINGDNTGISTGWPGTNGTDIDVWDGIAVADAGNVKYANGLIVKNNIIKNVGYFGVDIFGWYNYNNPPTSNHLIEDNLFEDFGTYSGPAAFWGGGVLIYNDNYTRIVNNVMTNVRVGVQTGNFHGANPGTSDYQVISGNTIQARRRGIFYNLHTGANVSPLTLSNNTITGLSNANETTWDGILMSSLSHASGIASNNNINGSGVAVPSQGYEVWNVKDDAPAMISGGMVDNVDIGLFLNNFEGYNSDAGNGAHAIVTSLVLNPNIGGIGIRVIDSPSSTVHAPVALDINAGVTVTGGSIGLSVENANASIVGGSLDNLTFTSTTSGYIQLVANSGDLDATMSIFEGETGASADLSENYAIEDKILHKVDDNSLGFVRVKSAEVFVTIGSGSVQRGVDAATANDIINVDSGTFVENVTVDKALTLKGANVDVACGSRSMESLVSPAGGIPFVVTSDDVTINGFEVSAPASTNAVVESGDVSGLSVLFNNIHDIGTTLMGGNVHAVVYNLGGINTSNITVSDNCFNNISSTSLEGASASAIGILQSTSTGTLTGLNIERNTITNVHVSNAQWSTGKIAYGIQINVGGNGSFLTNGKVVNAVIASNDISMLSGHISTAIGLEGNTQNAVVANNSVNNLVGTKNSGTRNGGGYDLSALKFEANRYVSTVTVENNSFETNTFTNNGTPNLGYAVSNYVTVTDGGTAMLNCNWMGTVAYGDIIDNATFTGKIFNKTDCETTFEPYLVVNTEEAGEETSIGFQPLTPTPCDAPVVSIISATPSPEICASKGSITVVFVDGTMPFDIEWVGPENGSAIGISSPYTIIDLDAGTYEITVKAVGSQATMSAIVEYLPVTKGANHYATIQAAIDAAASNDVIEVCAGNYTEDLTVTESVRLNGANAGTSGCGSRGAESTLSPTTVGATPIVIAADGVTIAGFTVTNPDGNYAILNTTNDNLTIENNVITGIGTNTLSGNTHAIYVQSNSGAMDGISITGNKIYDVRGGEQVPATTNGTASAIFIGDSNSNNDVTNLIIQANCIELVRASILPFASNSKGGRGAYGILLGSGASGSGDVVSPLIQSNSITDIEGLWAHAIGLEGNTPGAFVLNNAIVDIMDHKSPSDAVAVLIEDNSGAATVKINNNSFTNVEIGVWNKETVTIDANCNWWGTTDPGTITSKINGFVDAVPFTTVGTDNSVSIGFQPIGGSCDGYFPIHNVTQALHFATIQGAIEDTRTVNDDIIQVIVADYTEPGQIHIDKDLTIKGLGKNSSVVRSNYANTTGGHGVPAAAWIYTDPGTEVHFSDMTLDASGINTKYGIVFKSNGSVTNIAINEIKHSASPYLGTAIQVLDGNVDVSGCMFTEIGRIGVHYRNGVIPAAVISGTYDSNIYTGKGSGDWLDYALDISGGTTIIVSNSEVSENKGVASTDGSTSGGILVTSYFPTPANSVANDVTITGNDLHDNTTGIVVGYDAVDISNVTANGNDIYNNGTGLTSTGPTVDATENYWGAVDGPSGVGSGSGNGISANVNACPFYNALVATGTLVDCEIKNLTTMESFFNIQDAIDDAQTTDGDIISVPEGSYAEDLTLNKAVVLQGPFNTTPGCDGSRGTGEAVIKPATNQGTLIAVTVAGAEIKGFTIDGNAGSNQALSGIVSIDNIIVANNILKNFTNDSGTSMNTPLGIAVIGGASMETIADNCISNVTSMSLANVASGTGVAALAVTLNGDISGTIASNTVTGSDVGIGLIGNTSGSLTVTDNTINSGLASTFTTGLLLSEINGTSVVNLTGNNVITNTAFGVFVAGSTSTNTLNIENVNLDQNGIGVYGTNILPAGPTSETNFEINNLTITNSAANGIYLVESGLSSTDINVTVTGTDISGTQSSDNNSSAIAVFDGDAGAAGEVNLTVSNSNLHDNLNRGMVVAGNVSVNNTILNNNGAVPFSSGEGLNVILRPTAQAVSFTECEFIAPASGADANVRIEDGVIATFYNNSFEQGGAAHQFDFFAIGVNAPEINAAGNWWGSTNDATIRGSFDGNVGNAYIDYSPYLGAGTDTDVGGTASTLAFQGDFANDLHVDAESAQFGSGSSGNIQEGVDEIVATKTLYVHAGTYLDNVTINKAVILSGANAGTSGCDTRVAESTVYPAASGVTPFVVAANGVTIDGFMITNPAGGNAITNSSFNNMTVQNNIISEIGTTRLSGNTHAVYVSSNSGEVDMVNVNSNKFYNIRGGETLPAVSNGTSSAIFIGDSNSNNDVSNLTIEANCIEMVRASILPFASANKGGKGAYGILLGAGATGDAEVVNPLIQNNSIDDLEGLWAHAIGLEGNTPGALVVNNSIDDIVDHKTPTDAVAVLVEDNTGAASISINDNSFTNVEIGVWNKETVTVDASCNWWGTIDPVSITNKTNGFVTTVPFINDGTDDQLLIIGFQPISGSCDGDFPIYNSTQDIYFSTIQGAIDDTRTMNNDVIRIVGTFPAVSDYTEPAQIHVTKPVTIEGYHTDKSKTILRPGINTGSSGDARGFVLVAPGIEFHLKNLTMDGTGKTIWQGIRTTGSGTVDNVRFTEIKFNESGPHYAGTAIAAFGTGNVDVVNSIFDEIGRVGVLYFGTGISGSNFTNNTYTGKGIGDWLDNALDISAGANVSVSGNTISGNRGVASSDGSTSTGILVTTFFAPGTSAFITANELTDNTTGIAVGFDGSDASTVVAHNNNISGNDFGVTSTAPTVDASDNWWGAADGPAGVGPGTTGDAVSTDVEYCPWLAGTYPGGSPFTPTLTIGVTETSGTTDDDGTICNGASVTLDATMAGATAYVWTPAGVTDMITPSPSSTTIYAVSVTIPGCEIIDDQEIVVKDNPTIASVVPSAAEVCEGETVSFMATGLLDGENELSYTVTGPGGTFTGTETAMVSGGMFTFPATVYPVGTYDIIINSSTTIDGCTTIFSSGNTAIFTVNPLPSGTLTAVSPICHNTIAQLTFTASVGTGPFELIINGVTYSNITSGVAFPASSAITAATLYELTSVTDNKTCNTISAPISSVTVNMETTAPTVLSTDSPDDPDVDDFACGSTHMFNTDPSQCGVNVSITKPTWEDNCGGSVTRTQMTNNGTSLSNLGSLVIGGFPAGSTIVTFKGTDIVGNMGTCTVTIMVTDTEPPSVAACTENQVGVTAPGTCSATVTMPIPVFTDNCSSIASVTHSATGATTFSGSGLISSGVFNAGVTTVQYTATDAGGMTNTDCMFTVTITDNQAPVITACSPPVNVNANNAGCSATGVALGMPTYTDNCSNQTVTNDSAEPFPLGITTVTWTVSDDHGPGSVTCVQTVTVGSTATASITLTETSGETPDDGIICDGDMVTLTANAGGTDYMWSTLETTQSIMVGSAGSYTVTVTDVNDCTAVETSATIVVVPAITDNTIVLGFSSPVCNNVTTAIISNDMSAPSGGTGSLTYQWEYSSDGGTIWDNAIGASATIDEYDVIEGGYAFGTYQFRRLVASGGCVDVSNTVTVQLDDCGIPLQAKAFLSGPYNAGAGLMNDGLRSAGLIPLTEPYSLAPYSGPQFTHVGGGGGETIDPSVLLVTGDNAIVDWVFLELRDMNDPTTVLFTRSALLQRDGDIVEVDGVYPVLFGGATSGDYFVAVKHRNHLGIMSFNSFNMTTTAITVIDFSSIAVPTFGTEARRILDEGVFGMWAGEGNGDGKVVYQGAGTDITPITIAVFTNPLNINFEFSFPVNGYLRADYNMNGQVVYQGAGTDITPITISVFTNPLNINFEFSFPVIEQLP